MMLLQVEQLEQTAQTVAQTAQAAVQAPAASGPDWDEVLMIAAMGLGLVFAVLVLLVGVMRLFGVVFEARKQILPIVGVEPEELNEEEVAAIGVALKLYKKAYRSSQSEALTINRMARVYSPWNSKIHSLTQMPEHRTNR